METGEYFALSWEWHSEEVADGFLVCQWKLSNSSITVKCDFISAFLLHSRGSSATSVSILAVFPRDPRGPCHLRLLPSTPAI